jgi:hypothetical protein
MKGLFTSLVLVLFIACSASDDVYLGSRGNCEFGGTLTDCENAKRTVMDACWREVDCGAIPLHRDNPNDNGMDWDTCVDRLERTEDDVVRLVVACIASSTCDELRTGRCFDLGDIPQ